MWCFLCVGLCLSNQVSCGNGEIDCFDAKDKCNGAWDCQEHGGDEIHCGKRDKWSADTKIVSLIFAGY